MAASSCGVTVTSWVLVRSSARDVDRGTGKNSVGGSAARDVSVNLTVRYGARRPDNAPGAIALTLEP